VAGLGHVISHANGHKQLHIQQSYTICTLPEFRSRTQGFLNGKSSTNLSKQFQVVNQLV